MSVKCGYCKKTGQTIAHVKACAVISPDVTVKKTLPTPIVMQEVPAPVAEPFIPAHRKAKMQLAAAQALAVAAPAAMVCTEGADNHGNTETAPLVAPAPVVKTGQDLELGMYQVKHEDGTVTIYKVKFNKAGTYKLAERLWITQKDFFNKEKGTWDTKPSGKFHFAKSMMAVLTSDNKMSDADAKAFHDMTKAKYGVDYGFCCVCGKLLTVKKSIANGIGPVCAKNF